MCNHSPTVRGLRALKRFLCLLFPLWIGYKKKSGFVRSNCLVMSMQAHPGIPALTSNNAALLFESVTTVTVHLIFF